MRYWTIGLAALAFAGGCKTHEYLADNTLSTLSTLADLNYRLVLNNVAMFASNPSAIPAFAIINAGTVTADDLKDFSSHANYAPTMTFPQEFGGNPILLLAGGSACHRELTENWSMVPVTDADNLRRLRCAFQLLVAGNGDECGRCLERLSLFFPTAARDPDCFVPRGWFHLGTKKEVPREACYVGHYCDVYAWVTCEGREGLSRFTLTALDLASGKLQIPQKTVLKTFKPEGKLESIQETTTEVDQAGLEQLRKGGLYPDRGREPGASPAINPGLFFLPRL